MLKFTQIHITHQTSPRITDIPFLTYSHFKVSLTSEPQLKQQQKTWTMSHKKYQTYKQQSKLIIYCDNIYRTNQPKVSHLICEK